MQALLPPNIVETIQLYFGDRGRRWIAALPAAIENRCSAWKLTIAGEPLNGGTHSFVSRVRRGDGSFAILKIPVVDEENFAEPTALRLYDGDGAVRLYEYDPETGAMLLELAAPGEPLVEQDLTGGPHREGLSHNIAKVELGCRLYRRLARPYRPVAGFPQPPKVTDQATWFGTELVKRLKHSGIPQDIVDRFIAWSDEFAAYTGPEYIVNRDTHLGNIVSAQREPWLLIDPKPLIGEPAFDAGYLLGIQVESNPDPALVPGLVARVAQHRAVPADRARGWAFVRAVEEVVYKVEDGHDPARWMAIATILA